jgi:hypothetical protein
MRTRTLVGHCAKAKGPVNSGPFVSSLLSMSPWLRGVDLNHRPLGYEPDENRNYNNLQDAGGPRKTL